MANSKITPPRSIDELEDKLSEPSPQLCESLRQSKGDIIILGIGGKIGPSLARMAKRACEIIGNTKRIIGVSRFSEPDLEKRLNEWEIETIKKDLNNPETVNSLPIVENVIYLLGRKFGTQKNTSETWMTNVFTAGLIAHHFRHSRIVAFSSGNVYPFVPIYSAGATEQTPPAPIGEYAITCLGRERMFEYTSLKFGTKVLLLRLNYATELRYGVLVDIAQSVLLEKPIDLTTGVVNVIWQGYVNEVALRCFEYTNSPPRVLNITGPEMISVRWLAEQFGKILGKQPKFINQEASTALLSNASLCHSLFGYPNISLTTLIEWTAEWIRNNKEIWNKPTHFEVRNGQF